MNRDTLRAIVVVGALWVAFASPTMPGVSVPPYAGGMSGLHTAAASMAPGDRAALSSALAAAADAVAADTRGMIDTTEKAQRVVFAVLEFSYVGMGKPSAKYPAVAEALSTEMRRVVGDTAGPFDATGRGRLAAAFREAAGAVR